MKRNCSRLYHNTEQSYVYKCYIQGLLPNLDILQKYLLKYAPKNLIKMEKRAHQLGNLPKEYPYFDLEYVPLETGPSNDPKVHYDKPKESSTNIASVKSTHAMSTWFFHILIN